MTTSKVSIRVPHSPRQSSASAAFRSRRMHGANRLGNRFLTHF
jgi:hypothetical protein